MQVHNDNNLPTAPIADLLPTQGNLKDLTEKNYKKLKNVIQNRGFSVPVYVWEDDKGIKHLLDGHQRRQVLTTEGWSDPVPYLKIPAENLQEAMARLLEITSQYATITQEGIDEFMSTYELEEAEVYEATSFDALGKYGDDEEPEIEEDEAPEVSSEPAVSKLGEIYQLGRHRVMCGDSTVKENVELLMNGEKADMVFTDPPYGMSYNPNMSDTLRSKKGNWIAKMNNYSEVIGDSGDFKPELVSTIFDNFSYVDEIFIWGADYFAELIPNRNKGSWTVWDKRAGVEDMKWSTSEFELCWSKARHHRKTARITWSGILGTEQEHDHADGRAHPTQKPTKLAVWFFNNWGKDIKNIIDIYLGSGSTLIACEQTDRTCYGMELDPKYVDVIRKRYAKFVSPDNYEDKWQELTPAINNEKIT